MTDHDDAKALAERLRRLIVLSDSSHRAAVAIGEAATMLEQQARRILDLEQQVAGDAVQLQAAVDTEVALRTRLAAAERERDEVSAQARCDTGELWSDACARARTKLAAAESKLAVAEEALASMTGTPHAGYWYRDRARAALARIRGEKKDPTNG